MGIAMDTGRVDVAAFAREIGVALTRSTGESKAAAKTISAWTGADERTAKNWLAGRYGPNGHHLIALARHSDEVLETFLVLVGQRALLRAHRLRATRSELKEAVITLMAMLEEVDTD
ncbi:MAG: hypothetical protein ABTQ31_03055 [Rhizobiaceae bacterium]